MTSDWKGMSPNRRKRPKKSGCQNLTVNAQSLSTETGTSLKLNDEPTQLFPDGVTIGTIIPDSKAKTPVLWTDDAELRPHMDRPWMRAYVSALVGIAAQPEADPTAGIFSVPDWALQRHTYLFGATGGGKSRLALHLISEHLRQGGSALILDPKSQTIAHVLERCRAARLDPERIVVLDPADPSSGIPGWNPLLTALPPAQSAGDLVAILKESSESWGPRLSDILINALILLGAYCLSLYEAPRFLTRPDYRSALLRLPLPPDAKAGYRSEAARSHTSGGAAVMEARAFFDHEFSAWPRSDQAKAVAPVLTRIRSLLGSDFLQPLLCARRNTLDLPSLWQRPGAVLVHLDRTALGDDGARLLGGLLAHQMERTALRSPGPVPVLLALDELGAQERFIGSALKGIVSVSRSQNLRLLAATQHLAGLSAELRESLLINAGVQVAFQTGHDDARMLGNSFGIGVEETLVQASASVAARDHATGMAQRTTWRHTVRDGRGQALRLSGAAWQEFHRYEGTAPPGKGAALLRVQSLAAACGVARLYVHAADTEMPVALSIYVRGLSEDEYWFDGPSPLELIVSFPRPKFTNVKHTSSGDVAARWTRRIHKLPTQHAVARVRSNEPEVIRVLDVETSDGAVIAPAWTLTARRTCSQSYDEIEDVAAWRAAQVEAVVRGRGPLPYEGLAADAINGAAMPEHAVEAAVEIGILPNESAPAPPAISDAPSLTSGTDRIIDSVRAAQGQVRHRHSQTIIDARQPQKAANLSERERPLLGSELWEEVDPDGSIA